MKGDCPNCKEKKRKKLAENADGVTWKCLLCGRHFFVRHLDLIPERKDLEETTGNGPVYLRYGRISELGDGSLAKEKQDEATLEFSKRVLEPKGYRDGGFWFDESVSGTIPFTERVGAGTLWRCARRGDCIVVSKLDRAFRKCLDALEMVQRCKESGIDLYILDIGLDTNSPVGHLVLTVLAGVAEMERSLISARIKEDSAARKRAGRPFNGHAPIGWVVARTAEGSVYKPDKMERAHCMVAMGLHGKGYTALEIATSLREEGVVGREGRPYSVSKVQNMIKAAKAGFPDPKEIYNDPEKEALRRKYYSQRRSSRRG